MRATWPLWRTARMVVPRSSMNDPLFSVMVRRLPFQNNHGGGIVTGMGEREVQLFLRRGRRPFPEPFRTERVRACRRAASARPRHGGLCLRRSRTKRLDRGLLGGEPRGHMGNGACGRGGGIAGNGAPFVVRHDAVEKMLPETMQRTLHAGKFDQVQSDADDCHMRPLGQQVAVSGGRSQVDAVPPDGYTWKK